MYDCDDFDYLTSYYSERYIDDLIKKCKKHEIDLVIPCHDDEALKIAQNLSKFRKEKIKVLVSNQKIIALCRNKELLGEKLNKISNIFVKSFSKDDLLSEKADSKEYPMIAKPKKGFASQDIKIISSTEDLVDLDPDFVIQEYAFPRKDDLDYRKIKKSIADSKNSQYSEISIQLVFDQKGNLMGKMMSRNRLKNGIPIEIIPFENKKIWQQIDSIVPFLLKNGLKGPINLQGRITDNGLKLFEINPRFTGITGLRALLGFNEVVTCVKEWLSIDTGKNHLKNTKNKFGVRTIVDRSIDYENNDKVKKVYNRVSNIKENKKVIFITGATGYLAQNLIYKLSRDKNLIIWVFSRNKNKAKGFFLNKVERYYDYEDFLHQRIPFGAIDILFHAAFARPHNGYQLIADSLKFSNDIFVNAAIYQIPRIINISSQSVYGRIHNEKVDENSLISPNSLYGQAKYSVELCLESLMKLNKQINYTSIRLASVAGGAKGLVKVDILSKLVINALNNEDITIYGQNQEIQRIDINDALDAFMKLIKSNSNNWKRIYNLGTEEAYTASQIAQKILDIAKKNNIESKSKLIHSKKEDNLIQNLDSSLFRKEFKWKPKYKIDDSIDSLIKLFKFETKKNC